MDKIRLLNKEEIDVRVQSLVEKNKKYGVILLLYKDARVDMRILDEVFGMCGWQRRHEVVNENLFCTISIWDDEKKQWVDKQDVGIESKEQPEKGEASDSFKRAGTNVGIGRELYTSPFIWVDLVAGEYSTDKNGNTKAQRWLKFTVKDIGYNDAREINRLVICDNNGKERYVMGKKVDAPTEPTFHSPLDTYPEPTEPPMSGDEDDILSCSVCKKVITSAKSKQYYADHPEKVVKCFDCNQRR